MVASGDRLLATDSQTLASYTTGKPLVRLVAQSTQSCANNTTISVNFGAGSEDIDTHGYHDTVTNNSRITPLTAGYWKFTGKAVFGAKNDYRITDAFLRKNGATSIAGSAGRQNQEIAAGGGTSTSPVVWTIAIVSMNGTTDYMELMAVQTNVAATDPSTNASGTLTSTFEAEFLRPL